MNRKHCHSVNVQVTCDAQKVLTNVVAKWPGSTHDSCILPQSSIGRKLQAGVVMDEWLLGKICASENICLILRFGGLQFLKSVVRLFYRGAQLPPAFLTIDPIY